MSAIPRSPYGMFQPAPGNFDRTGFKTFLRTRGAPTWYARDIPSRLKRVERTIGAGRITRIDPYDGGVRQALRDAASFDDLHRVVQWQLLQAAEDYEQFLTANDFDEAAFRAYLARNDQSATSIRDNVARIWRLRRLMGVQPFVEQIVRQRDLDQALATVDAVAQRQELSNPIRHQIRRAVTYLLFHVNAWPTDSTAFPAQRRQNAPTTLNTGEVAFDRDGFRQYLQQQGVSGKRLSDRLSHIARVARHVGAETFQRLDDKPFVVKDALEQAAQDNDISKDVLGQLLRALRDYAFYRFNIDPENPDPWVLALTQKRTNGRPGRPGIVTGNEPAQKRGRRRRRKRKDVPRHPDGSPMTKEAIEQQRQAEIQAFLEKNGATECPTKTADGAVLLENLGLD